MPFKDVPNRIDYIKQEHDVLKFWKENQSFEKMRTIHAGKPHWSFIDGPITANNPMGVHHGWGRTYKDLYNRYWTMRGRELRYQNGFDCQGLWVEVEVERELGFTTKKDIEDFGLAEFVRKCKERVLRFAAVQTEQSIRLGYWMDWNDPDELVRLADALVRDSTQEITVDGPRGPITGTVEQIVAQLGLPDLGGSYFTFSDENNYMIWHFLKKCWKNGWLYRGADVMPWCPRCATAISQHEIVTDGYAELTHPSVTLRFPLRERAGESLLVWTTTPWTLTSNVAAAVGPDLTYVKVRNQDQVLYLSKGTTHMLKGEYEILEELKGDELEGWAYDGPFDDLTAAREPGGITHLRELIEGIEQTAADIHRVILWDDVGESEGTGIVHIAPGCGAEDYELSKELRLPLLAPLNDEGYFVAGFDWLTEQHVSEIAQPIFDDLEKKDVLYDVEDYTHRYPTCWRCGTELVFRLVDEWFISMGEKYNKERDQVTEDEKERSLRYQIMDVVDQIRWIPEFGHAREMDWLRNMHDWMISKKRYWGLALPIWTCDECDHFEVIGDDIELKERAVTGYNVLEGHTPHRPYIDAVKINCPQCESQMSRIPDVGNPWLDAGIVSFSTMAYRSDPDYWRKWYPAHWISESFPGQFRNWFYSLLAMATVVDNSPPFLENFGYATLLAEDGREMHKSWGNSIEFNEAADRMGVDVMRWLYCAHKPENNLLFGYNRADEVRRGFLIPLWNVYSFFTTYANLDQWQPEFDEYDPAYPEGETPKSDNLLDRWILARINQVCEKVTPALENSDAYVATLAIDAFLDDMTNWYVRRSRRRFWKSEQDTDKDQAYATLYHVLVKLIKLLAPFTPFITEVMYQNLVREVQTDAYESVHHCSWPSLDSDVLDDRLVEEMALARRIASLGLSARSSAGIKVRQPLAKVSVHVGAESRKLSPEFIAIVIDELNVKAFEFVDDAESLVSYKILPNNEVLGPRLGAQFPQVRKALDKLRVEEIVTKIRAESPISMEIDGKSIEIQPGELIIQTEPKEGLAVAADRMVTVAVETAITQDLKLEGLAREFVRRIQALRKDADLKIDDRILTYLLVEDDLLDVVNTWRDYIMSETLSVELTTEPPPKGVFAKRQKVDGNEVEIGIQRK